MLTYPGYKGMQLKMQLSKKVYKIHASDYRRRLSENKGPSSVYI
jgi:hypothetical protein